MGTSLPPASSKRAGWLNDREDWQGLVEIRTCDRIKVMTSLIKRHKIIFIILTFIIFFIIYVLFLGPMDMFLRNQITELTHKEANDISQCKVIRMGSKGCGGAQKYIIYSTENTNVFLLKTVVLIRDTISYPERFMGSDCSIEIRPSSFKIVGGKCRAEYAE